MISLPGTISSAKVEPRQIFEETIKTGMSHFILVHNHPSGDVTPSQKDLELTEIIKQGANLLGLNLIDHIIIGDGNFQSILVNQQKRTKNKERMERKQNETIFN